MKYLLDGQQSDRLFFRKIKSSDFENWLPFFENPDASKFWMYEKESPETECTKWYEKQYWRYENNKGGMNAVIEKKSGDLAGHCGLLIQLIDEVVELEIAYSFLPQFWNKGYATEAAKKCRDFAFENNLSASLISIISLNNIPSQKVALKNKMQLDKTTFYSNNEVYIYRVNKA